MTKFIIPFLAFLAPIVLFYFAWRYHKKALARGEDDKFAWTFIIIATIIGWGGGFWLLMYNLDIWS
jgi:hypothetical protein